MLLLNVMRAITGIGGGGLITMGKLDVSSPLSTFAKS